MDEKISLEAIAQYGDAYSDKVLKDFFSSKETITGAEILSLCNVQQVNFFVISELFKNWREENKKLKSQYFNYENPDVKEALENLMTLLSKNISINRANFTPLLKKAVNQTLMVVFDPYDFFSLIISGDDNKLEVVPFKEELKYLKVNKAPLEKMLQKLEEQNVKEISGNEAFSILDQILEEVNFNPEDVEEYLVKFSAIVPLDANKFYVSKTQAPEPQKVIETEHVVQKEKTPPPPVNKSNHVFLQPSQSASINDSHGTRQGRPSIVDNFQRIKRIKDNLTINQKFMFTKVLFHGDFELFSDAIEHLDKLDSIKAAIRYIEDQHASAWDHDSEEFHEFMELVEKRFV
ncbi:MAG TPA: hypothetical protein VFG46_29680 [Chryseolinea sp.]|nr:hypothetical protein [Chryseolinea sp.]